MISTTVPAGATAATPEEVLGLYRRFRFASTEAWSPELNASPLEELPPLDPPLLDPPLLDPPPLLEPATR